MDNPLQSKGQPIFRCPDALLRALIDLFSSNKITALLSVLKSIASLFNLEIKIRRHDKENEI
jgi:hypothetical protein